MCNTNNVTYLICYENLKGDLIMTTKKNEAIDKGTNVDSKNVIDLASQCPSYSNQESQDGQCKQCAKKKIDLFMSCTQASTDKKVAAKTVKKTVKTSSTPKAQLRAEFVKKVFTDAKTALTRKELAKKLQADFLDSENEARYQASMSIYYLQAFSILTEVEKDKFEIKKAA